MKQVLLLVAVYSLIINQSFKETSKAKDSFVPEKQIKESPKPAVQTNFQSLHILAPLFSYSAYQMVSGYTTAHLTRGYLPGKN